MGADDEALGADVALVVLQALDAHEQTEAAREQALIEWLDHIIIRTGLEARDFVVDAVAGGEEHNRQMRSAWLAAHLLAEGETTAVGEIDLTYQQVWHLCLQHVHCFDYAAREAQTIAIRQRGLHAKTRSRVFLYYENTQVMLPVYFFACHNPPLAPSDTPLHG